MTATGRELADGGRHLAESPVDGARRGTSWLVTAWLAVVLFWCAIPLSPSTTDGDFWGHVQYGRDTLRYGLDRVATYTYTAIGYRWINHENLSEIFFAAVTDRWGTGTLLGIKCLMGLSVLGLAAVGTRLHPLSWSFLWTLAAIQMSYYWATRPQIFSFTMFAWLIAGTNWVFADWSRAATWRGLVSRQQAIEDWRAVAGEDGANSAGSVARRLRWLWLVPVLMLVWTNTHGGFLAGLAVALLLLGGRLWQARHATLSIRVQIALVILASAAVTLCNPYGWRLHAWLYGSLRNPRPEVLEWMPPDWLGPGSWILWALVATVVVSILGTQLRRDPVQFLILAVVGWQAIGHRRHVAFVTILTLYWLAPHFESAMRSCLRHLIGAGQSVTISPAWRVCLYVSAAALGVSQAAIVWDRIGEMRVDRSVFPVAAVQYIADRGLAGRCLASAQWGQYLLATVGGRTPEDGGLQVAFDGRYDTCYPQAVIDMYFDFDRGDGGPDKRWRGPDSPPCDPERALDWRRPDYVLLARKNAHATGIMAGKADEWELVYSDSTAQLWARRRLANGAAPTRFTEALGGGMESAEVSRQVGWVAWPAAPRRSL